MIAPPTERTHTWMYVWIHVTAMSHVHPKMNIIPRLRQSAYKNNTQPPHKIILYLSCARRHINNTQKTIKDNATLLSHYHWSKSINLLEIPYPRLWMFNNKKCYFFPLNIRFLLAMRICAGISRANSGNKRGYALSLSFQPDSPTCIVWMQVYVHVMPTQTTDPWKC